MVNSFNGWLAVAISYVIESSKGFAKMMDCSILLGVHSNNQSGNTEVAYVNTPQHEVLDFKGDPVFI